MYTEGEWRVSVKRHADGRIYNIEINPSPDSGHSYKPICTVYHQFTTALADAQLIASAPDLYKALEAIRNCVIYDDDRASYAIDGMIQAQMLKALAKAGGTTE